MDKIKIIEFDEVNSTNDELKKLAAAGEPEGCIVAAKRQTKGRGRSGRQFYSPEGGIYMSILLRPKSEGFGSTVATAAAAVAVAKTAGRQAGIKWVNDVIIDNKKVCGILTEAVFGESAKPEFVIVGIGINCYIPEGGFPDELKNTAGAIFEPGEGDPAQLRQEVLDNFFRLYSGGRTKIGREYRERCITLGKRIEIQRGDELIVGTAVAIGDDFKLLLRTDTGKVIWLCSGEINAQSH
ncbi:MAG TPA: biotin--[acetyl-CoA-carboxylase] ligase [Oscillospiraceae bacterium]|nr:biotin--[acetyl-CoA-carboxylase] ligase [Oscillospiraceae bacterium]HPS35848.1 biotin--[acetyl-CoA-carboxylase] ligase [Oscillospiraceae bacterium]